MEATKEKQTREYGNKTQQNIFACLQDMQAQVDDGTFKGFIPIADKHKCPYNVLTIAIEAGVIERVALGVYKNKTKITESDAELIAFELKRKSAEGTKKRNKKKKRKEKYEQKKLAAAPTNKDFLGMPLVVKHVDHHQPNVIPELQNRIFSALKKANGLLHSGAFNGFMEISKEFGLPENVFTIAVGQGIFKRIHENVFAEAIPRIEPIHARNVFLKVIHSNGAGKPTKRVYTTSVQERLLEVSEKFYDLAGKGQLTYEKSSEISIAHGLPNSVITYAVKVGVIVRQDRGVYAAGLKPSKANAEKMHELLNKNHSSAGKGKGTKRGQILLRPVDASENIRQMQDTIKPEKSPAVQQPVLDSQPISKAKTRKPKTFSLLWGLIKFQY